MQTACLACRPGAWRRTLSCRRPRAFRCHPARVGRRRLLVLRAGMVTVCAVCNKGLGYWLHSMLLSTMGGGCRGGNIKGTRCSTANRQMPTRNLPMAAGCRIWQPMDECRRIGRPGRKKECQTARPVLACPASHHSLPALVAVLQVEEQTTASIRHPLSASAICAPASAPCSTALACAI